MPTTWLGVIDWSRATYPITAATTGLNSASTLVAATGGVTTPGGRTGGDIVALDGTQPFATAWNQVMVRRRVQ